MRPRKPIVAGRFYENDPKLLKTQIEDSFKHELGPGMPNIGKSYGTVKGAIVPHAGYAFSGMCAAHSYKQIKESGDYDCFIVIGFSHSGLDEKHASLSRRDWETPLGIAEVDKELAEALIAETDIYENDDSHANEHSIEVQLPFLKYLYGDSFKFVPLSVSHNCDIAGLAAQIKETIKRSGKNVCYIASSDFTHFGPQYGFMPFDEKIQKNLVKLDMGAVEHIKTVNAKAFLEYVEETEATICGKNSIALLVEIIKNDVNRIELLKYYTSGELLGDFTHSVSYMSIIFENIKL